MYGSGAKSEAWDALAETEGERKRAREGRRDNEVAVAKGLAWNDTGDKEGDMRAS